MDREHLQILRDDLRRESRQMRTWAENMIECRESEYGVKDGSMEAMVLGEVAGLMRGAANNLEWAADKIGDILGEKR